jgi:purine-binding chemotaxis protein CheW
MTTDEPINWDDVRQGIEAVRATVAQGFAPSREEEQRILKERSHDLAREPGAAKDARNFLEVVEFELAGERYGLALMSVRTVAVLKDLTHVPCTPPFVFGIINLRGEFRGEICTIIDLKKFFGLPEAGITELNRVLIVGDDTIRLGILADAICGVREIELAALEASVSTLTGIRASYLKGVTADRLIVLDAAKILADDALLVREEVGS